MPQFVSAFWVQIVMYAVSFGAVYGTITTRLKNLEEKVNKHNNLIERMYIVEASAKSAHHRIDELRKDI
ncbi:MAG: hypothetical protein RSE10_03400 [Oscillospiraceae bacterium]